jgi:hypothetical protein
MGRNGEELFLCKSSADFFSCSFHLVPRGDRNNRTSPNGASSPPRAPL